MTVPSQDSQFQTMYRTHRDAIWSYCVRRVHRDDVEDAVADVFIVAWKKHDRAPTGEEMLPWLYGVARRVLANDSRSKTRSRKLFLRLGWLRGEAERDFTRRDRRFTYGPARSAGRALGREEISSPVCVTARSPPRHPHGAFAGETMRKSSRRPRGRFAGSCHP